MNRYQRRSSGIVVGMPNGGGRRRWLVVVTALLLVALIVLAVVAIPAMRAQQDTRPLYTGRLLTECDAAVRQVSGLSRTSSSNSYATLATIRSEVYAMSVLNDTWRGLNGASLVEEARFTSLFSIIEQYYATLITNGTQTGNLQTQLTQELTELQTIVAALAD